MNSDSQNQYRPREQAASQRPEQHMKSSSQIKLSPSTTNTTSTTTTNTTTTNTTTRKQQDQTMELVWDLMLDKDLAYHKLRDANMMRRHPTMLPTYRTILLSWLSQVSQEYKLHKETYHLAMDFFDRYLSTQTNIHKLQLQLIGTTCMFIASKFEEIRPPTVYEFADLTDGACTADEILTQELIILGAIRWEITPMTANSWLQTYLQLNSSPDKENARCPRRWPIQLIPYKIQTANYKMIVCLVDLALLDVGSLRFANSKLAAAALYLFADETTLLQCTGYKIRDLKDCIQWLRPYSEIVQENFQAQCQEEVEPCQEDNQQDEAKSEAEQLQQLHQHRADEAMLQMVHDKLAQDEQMLMDQQQQQQQSTKRLKLDQKTALYLVNDHEASPEKPTSLLTPPRSSRKRKRTTTIPDCA